MKNLFIISISIGFIFFIQTLSHSKPYEPEVKGGFKTCSVTEYRYKGGKPNKKGELQYMQTLDEKGNPIEIVSYGEKNKIYKNKIENKYNVAGLLIEKTLYNIDGNKAVSFIYEYDDSLNIISDFTYSSTGEITGKAYYKYDKNNFLIEEIHEIKVDSIFIKGITYFINDKFGNRIIEMANHSSSFSVEVSAKLNLTDSSAETEVKKEQSIPESDKIKFEYFYNEKNQIIKDIRYGIGGTKLIHGYSYDEFGNIKERISYDEDGKPGLKLVYEYGK